MTQKSLIAIVFAVVFFAAGVFLITFQRKPPEPVPGPSPVPSVSSSEALVETGPIVLNDDGSTPEGEKNLADSNNEFALDFYSKVKEDKNIFFSPYSIYSAFGMVYEGAAGETAEEIKSVFGFAEDAAERRSSFASVFNRLNGEEAEYDLSTANSLWAQRNYSFLSSYTDALKNFYGAEAKNVDFETSADNVRREINKWVEDKTNNKIKDLFSEGTIVPSTRLVLANAVYFKGLWELPFLKEATQNRDFYPDSGEAESVPTMSQKDDFKYAESEGVQVLELPYKGNDLSMVIFLPAKGKTKAFEDSLSIKKVNELKAGMEQKEVTVYIPKFKFDKSYSLKGSLAEMGIEKAFNPGAADFSGMDGTKNLFISEAVHQAFVEADEEGTEAAAATGIVMNSTALPPGEPTVFRADHPFIFVIQEKDSGNILFMGKVADPNS